MITQIVHDAVVDDPFLPVLIALGVIGLIVFRLDKRRTDGELMYLRAGKIPPSWETAYQKANPNSPPESDEIPPV